MANTTSGTQVFEKNFSIDEIVEESFERMGIQNVSGYQLKTSRRTLNIMFQEQANRGLHYWEVENTSITLATDQTEYTIFRSSAERASNGVTTTVEPAINSSVTNIPHTQGTNMPYSTRIKNKHDRNTTTGKKTIK